jgi:glycosyltransferase involved in cell wall biosynthesis
MAVIGSCRTSMMEGGSGVITKPSWGGIADGFRPRIGYAAFCQAVPECGRSAVAGNLRAGLGKVADVIDIWSAPVGRAPACDAILAMDCVGQIPEPYFIYLCPEQGNMLRVDPSVYERALGLFAERGRLAQWLAENAGIPAEKIYVIPPAAAASQGSPRIQPPYMREAPRRKLLLCISDHGGRPIPAESVRLILDVLDILRGEHDSRVRLTISGLEKWPDGSSPPKDVTFLGVPRVGESMALFDTHDVLVAVPGLGSYGLPEALSRGVPCVAARASEMSEAITPGVTGAVVEDGKARELAAAIASVLENDDIYNSCFERAPAMTAYFSWERVARQVTHVISREVGLIQ